MPYIALKQTSLIPRLNSGKKSQNVAIAVDMVVSIWEYINVKEKLIHVEDLLC